HDQAIKERLDELGLKKKKNHADQHDVIVTNTVAFTSRAAAIAYYEHEFGGPVAERNGKFVPVGGNNMPTWVKTYVNAVASPAVTVLRTVSQFGDGLQLNGSLMWVFSANVSVTKDGEFYGGVETPNVSEVVRTAVKNAESGRISPFGVSLTAVKILAPRTTKRDRQKFFSGSSFNASVGLEGGVLGYSRSGGQNAVVFGIGTPGINVGESFSRRL